MDSKILLEVKAKQNHTAVISASFRKDHTDLSAFHSKMVHPQSQGSGTHTVQMQQYKAFTNPDAYLSMNK